MALSPSGLVLAAVHFSGALSLWDLPSLRSKAVWNEADQVNIKKTYTSRQPRFTMVNYDLI